MIENFQLFLNVIMYFLNFSSIICLMFILTANFNYLYMFGEVFNNWSKSPINGFNMVEKIASENENLCPKGYEYLFKFTWPGTKSGCDCRGITNIKNMAEYEDKITTGSCSISQITAGCRIIPEIPGKFIHSIYDKYYCIKRNENFNYQFIYESNLYEKECPLFMKNCGIIDTVNNYLCVDQEAECPLQKINFNDDIGFFSFGEDNNNKNISAAIIESVKYLVDLKLSQGPVCINSLEINLLTENIYELINKNKKTKCPTKIYIGHNEHIRHDNRFYKIIDFPTNAIYYKEDFLLNNIELLPEFPKEYLQLPVTVFGRNYIGWKKKCQSEIINLKENYIFLSNLEITSLIYLISSLIVLIYCMILIMIMSELLQKKYFMKLMILIIYFFIVLILFFFLLYEKNQLSNVADFFLKLIKNSCSDYETNMLFLNLYMLILDISKFYVLTIIFYLCILFIGLLKILLTIYKLYKIHLLHRIVDGNVREFEMVLLL